MLYFAGVGTALCGFRGTQP